jgi:hypothetical protein
MPGQLGCLHRNSQYDESLPAHTLTSQLPVGKLMPSPNTGELHAEGPCHPKWLPHYRRQEVQGTFTCLETKLLQGSNAGDLLTCKARLFMPTRLCSYWGQQGNSHTSAFLRQV